jgi:hypothetical protein
VKRLLDAAPLAWRPFAAPVALTLGVWGLHLGVLLHTRWTRGLSLEAQLARWDALHYADIAARGYEGVTWAFYPLWPGALAALARPLTGPTGLALETCGALLAVGLFTAAVAVLAHTASRAPTSALAPGSPWGWFFLVASPASWVFHTAHTEALFLLVSVLAFRAAERGQRAATGLWAALAVLTRNQGLFVALASAVWLAARPGTVWERLRRAAPAVLLAGAAVTAWLAAQAAWAGTPWAFLEAQRSWPHATGLEDVLRALTFTNPRQPATAINVVDFALFWALLGLTAVTWRRAPVLAGYAGLSLAVIPLQSETTNVARFGAVLFPLWFELGRLVDRWPRAARWGLAVAAVWLNAWFAQRVSKGAWAY